VDFELYARAAALDRILAVIYKRGMITLKLPLPVALLAACVLLLPGSAPTADTWVEVKSAHFTVASDAGPKEAQKIADQFELIRQMFHAEFATLKVDPPQPIYIIAAKNEGTLKLYLPEEWEVKGHIHHAGLYQPGADKDYVVMRLDTEGINPFHVLYHEYTHALIRLNFANLPLWLNEGLADFYGNTTLGDKEIKTGSIDEGHLYILGQNKLIPIETLLQADHRSPYYNESNQANVFYAESWALVHYLLMDPQAREKQLLKSFLTAYDKSGDQIAAAKEAFGDLKQFGKKIDSYAGQRTFMVAILKIKEDKSQKNYASRALSPGEVLALRGDFFVHHNRVDQAQPVIDEALKTEPNLPLAHFAHGYYFYRKQQPGEADAEMTEAIKLGAADFAPAYFHGVLLQRTGSPAPAQMQEARKSLEKCIQLNPDFAPAYEAMSHAYSRSADEQKLAVNAALKAVQLDPGVMPYSVNLTFLLINNGRNSEAQLMVDRIRTTASSDSEKAMAANLQNILNQRKSFDARRQGMNPANGETSGDREMTTAVVVTEAGSSNAGSTPAQPSTLRKRGETYGIDGEITDFDCSKTPELTLSLELRNGGESTFHAQDLTKVAVTHADGIAVPPLKSCDKWEGRQVKIWFTATPGREFDGEITKMYFY
jgi:tetratricopeptide (TPR) repeat protein